MQRRRAVTGAVRRRGRARRRRPGVVLVTLVTVLAGGAFVYEAAGGDLQSLIRPRAYVEIDGEAVAVPRPAPAEGRLLPAVAVTTQGSHAFLHTDAAGAPVGYDPCRPVRYVVRPTDAPAGGQVLLEEAVAVVQAATGLRLEAAGSTDEEPLLERPLIQPDRYGPGWAPVLVAWSDESVVPELAGQVAGVGGSAAVPGADGTGTWLAAGRLVLDAKDVAELLERDGGAAQARAIMVHELAHVLGLDHVDDPAELMHPMTSTRTDLGPGDRQGLALVGQVACEE